LAGETISFFRLVLSFFHTSSSRPSFLLLFLVHRLVDQDILITPLRHPGFWHAVCVLHPLWDGFMPRYYGTLPGFLPPLFSITPLSSFFVSKPSQINPRTNSDDETWQMWHPLSSFVSQNAPDSFYNNSSSVVEGYSAFRVRKCNFYSTNALCYPLRCRFLQRWRCNSRSWDCLQVWKVRYKIMPPCW
jgi:hypothetical protein